MSTLVSREAHQKAGDRFEVFDHWAALVGRIVSSGPGLLARAGASQLGHFPEGRGSRDGEGAALPEKDLGGLRRCWEILSLMRSPRIANAGVFRSD
jgi:hypothetical protein